MIIFCRRKKDNPLSHTGRLEIKGPFSLLFLGLKESNSHSIFSGTANVFVWQLGTSYHSCHYTVTELRDSGRKLLPALASSVVRLSGIKRGPRQ